MIMEAYELYQVFSENEDHTLCVDTVSTDKEAIELYESKDGFLWLGIYGPTAFEVIRARPHGMALIS
jgi:hypothetical protein